MVSSFLREVEHAFAFLKHEPGYQLLGIETSDSFDNATIDFRSDHLRIRIIRERSDVFADFAPPDGPPHWFDSPTLLRYLGQQASVADYLLSDQRSLAALADLVRPYYARIAELYTASRRAESIKELRAVRDEQARRLWS